MTKVEDTSRSMRLDPDSFAGGYFRNAVYRHWDPYEDIPDGLLAQDRERFVADDPTETEFENFRRLVAMFGAGEEAVTEDLAPLLLVTDDVDEQMFLTSQLYEEAKHTAFFDRYWREVINPVAEALGHEVTAPTDQRYFNDDYVALFDATEAAMERLLEDDSPDARARAFCHYHLVIESVLAQTGYYSIQSIYSPRGEDGIAVREMPHLEGLVEGVTRIRSDEGRHVGFGMAKVRELVQSGAVDGSVVQETLSALMGHVAGVVTAANGSADPAPLVEYAHEKLTRRIEIITEADAVVPDVEELVRLDGSPPEAAD
jgi:ribonucleoside-diphosphate reductase beta chain